MKIRQNIPNALTCGNLLCGCLAIAKVFEGNLAMASCLVGIALVLDFFDGFVARMLQVASPIGKDLDSLADMVTFGVVPGFMMFKLIGIAYMLTMAGPDNSAIATGSKTFPLQYLALIIPVFSCIRLAKFNNDTRQTESFIGLNTPSNAMVICSFPLILQYQPGMHFMVNTITSVWFLAIFTVVMSFMLVSELPFFSLKVKNLGWSDNKLRFILVGSSVALLVALHFAAVPFIILLYILISIVNNIFLKKKV